jgi:hypothetical protein
MLIHNSRTCPFKGHQAVGDGQWQVMHSIHVSEGTEVKKLLPWSSRTISFLDNICYLLYFRQHIRGFHNIILENPTYFFLSTTSAPAEPVSHPEVGLS